METISGTVKIISKYGGIQFEETDGWYNPENEPLKQQVIDDWRTYKGARVVLELATPKTYVGITLDPTPARDESLALPVKEEKMFTPAAEAKQEKYAGVTVGMSINNAVLYLNSRGLTFEEPAEWAITVVAHARALLEEMRRQGL